MGTILRPETAPTMPHMGCLLLDEALYPPEFEINALFLMKNENITGEIINIDSGQRLAWNTPDIINTKE